MPIKSKAGGDPTKAIKQNLLRQGKKVTREAVTVWNTEAQKRIAEAAQGRTSRDAQRDQRGDLQGRKDNDLHELYESFTPPQWVESEKAWVFAVTHEFAREHEWGAQPHEIQAKNANALVFEWPDMPREVEEKFEPQWESDTNSLEKPQVAFDSVDHPGVPAIGYLRHGRQKARQRLEDAGIDARAFGLGEGSR
jgi:hypothetical protein